MDIHSNENDRNFLKSIIKMICDYAKKNNANKDEVFMDIATTFVEMVSTQRYEIIGDDENEKAETQRVFTASSEVRCNDQSEDSRKIRIEKV